MIRCRFRCFRQFTRRALISPTDTLGLTSPPPSAATPPPMAVTAFRRCYATPAAGVARVIPLPAAFASAVMVYHTPDMIFITSSPRHSAERRHFSVSATLLSQRAERALLLRAARSARAWRCHLSLSDGARARHGARCARALCARRGARWRCARYAAACYLRYRSMIPGQSLLFRRAPVAPGWAR